MSEVFKIKKAMAINYALMNLSDTPLEQSHSHKRKPGGKNRDKVKAARKQRRKQRT